MGGLDDGTKLLGARRSASGSLSASRMSFSANKSSFKGDLNALRERSTVKKLTFTHYSYSKTSLIAYRPETDFICNSEVMQ